MTFSTQKCRVVLSVGGSLRVSRRHGVVLHEKHWTRRVRDYPVRPHQGEAGSMCSSARSSSGFLLDHAWSPTAQCTVRKKKNRAFSPLRSVLFFARSNGASRPEPVLAQRDCSLISRRLTKTAKPGVHGLQLKSRRVYVPRSRSSPLGRLARRTPKARQVVLRHSAVDGFALRHQRATSPILIWEGGGRRSRLCG